MPKLINECGVILLDKNSKKVLIIFQKESLKWGLPKGHLKEIEKINNLYYDCAKRELLEETGIMINNHKHKNLGTFIIRDKLFYVLQLSREIALYKPIDTVEIGAIKWLELSEIIPFLNKYNCNVTLKELYRYISTVYRSHHKIASV